MTERITIGLSIEVSPAHGPSEDSPVFPHDEKTRFSIAPLAEQNLKSGSIILEVLTDGKGSSERVYMPVKEGQVDRLTEALEEFEKAAAKENGLISIKRRIAIQGAIEVSVSGVHIIGPEGLTLF